MSIFKLLKTNVMKIKKISCVIVLFYHLLLTAQVVEWSVNIPIYQSYPSMRGFNSPLSITTDSNDNIFVSWVAKSSPGDDTPREEYIAKYDSSGNLVSSFGTNGVLNITAITPGTNVYAGAIKVLPGNKLFIMLTNGSLATMIDASTGVQDTSFGYLGYKDLFLGGHYIYKSTQLYEYDNHFFITNNYKDILNNVRSEVICYDKNLNIDTNYLNQGRLDIGDNNLSEVKTNSLYFYEDKLYAHYTSNTLSEYNLNTGVKNLSYGVNGNSSAGSGIAKNMQFGKAITVDVPTVSSMNRQLYLKRYLPNGIEDISFIGTGGLNSNYHRFHPIQQKIYVLPNNKILLQSGIDPPAQTILMSINPQGGRDLSFGGPTTNQPNLLNGMFDVSQYEYENSFLHIRNNYLILASYNNTNAKIVKIMLDTTTLSTSENNSIEKGKQILAPNPISDKSNLFLDKIYNSTTATIFNVDGKKLSEIKIKQKNTEIDFSFLPTGNYILKVKNLNQEQVIKFIKK